MKRTLLIVYAGALLLLCSCGGRLFSGHRDMEHLRPVQTVGLDAEGDDTVLTVAAGAGPDDAPPLVMTGSAASIESAAARLQDQSPREELFYAHTRYLLLGEAMAARDLEAVLDWVERSPAMRMDIPLLVVRGRADGLMTAPQDGDTDITGRLDALRREQEARSQPLPTLRQTASSLLEQGWALCLAAEAAPDEGTLLSPASEGAAAVSGGLALLRTEERAPVFLTAEESLGVRLAGGKVAGTPAPAGECVLELLTAKTEALPLVSWEEDKVTGLLLRCRVEAGLLEGGAEEDPAPALEALAARCLTRAAALARETGCDLLSLGDQALYDLPLTVEVRGEVTRGYDLKLEGTG